MEQSPKQQTVELLKRAKRVVVMAHQSPDGDGIGSMLALVLALRKLGKEAQAISADPVPAVFDFLPATAEVTDQLSGSSDEFVITLDTTTVAVDKLGYKNYPDEKQLKIVIKAKQGQITEPLLSFSAGGAAADLIVVLDTNDVERLGSIYPRYADLFYKTPIINIDHHPGNDYFGKVNWVDLAATSTAEMLVALLESLSGQGEKALLDADIATLLLTGITTDTGSFQNTNTTPKSFTVAAQLVAAGARQQEIVQHIYKTKPLSTLKLWGTVLSKIQEDRERRFIWSTVAAGDFKAFDAADSETGGVIDELLKTVPDIDFALLLSEKRGDLTGSLRGVSRQVNVADVAKLFGGGGHEMAAAFRIAGGSLADNESEIIDKIRAFQAARLTSPAPAAPESPGRFNLPDAGDTFSPDTPLTKPVPADTSTPAIPSVASLESPAAVPPAPAVPPKSLKEQQATL